MEFQNPVKFLVRQLEKNHVLVLRIFSSLNVSSFLEKLMSLRHVSNSHFITELLLLH